MQGRSEETIEIKVKIANKLGIHMRPSDLLAKIALKYKCAIRLRYANASMLTYPGFFIWKGITADGCNCKSMLDLCKVEFQADSDVIVKCEGSDARAACMEIARFLSRPANF